MKLKFKGFTLIELLIVVAIIAILAAIAVPNFLEAQIRSKVSRAKTDMRTVATALEAYFVDTNTYVGSATADTANGFTVNSMLSPAAASDYNQAASRLTFATYRPAEGADQALGQTLTTPIAYLTSIPSDPFADTKGSSFGYFNASDAGWIAWSYGPDTDETKTGGQIQTYMRTVSWSDAGVMEYDPNENATAPNSIYNPYTTNPREALKSGYTYDATNGTNSAGDVWRVKE